MITGEHIFGNNFKDKVAVITGGSRGIGKAVADALIKRGAKVVIGDILEAEGQVLVNTYNELANEKVAIFIRTDVTKYADNQALFKLAEHEFGGVDLALLNAGIGSNANSTFSPMDDQLDERIIDINTTAVIKGTKVAVLHMAKRGGGSIVHLASVAGFYSSFEFASYNASKHAVIGYTRSFDFLPRICNVRVNALCPYWVETDLIQSITNLETPLQTYVKLCPRTPMQTVVDGVLTLFADESMNIQTLMALPKGLEIMEPIRPLDLSSSVNKGSEMKAYADEVIPKLKAQLKAAITKYNI
ncbi:uncharacterized protein BX663DRAFT_524008 [Cokeromyces recurvatus]|uniref:uncharacterized protein n=1 Tax=Cokeromyces recurvatus TaxID=90255 RepID=UPI00222068BD|nr:uncharacterized protein BX663DRAFT_524008 [Cokeromyces recurvatus]KAI7898592.1 hypothetical protein BX663DRAFT_524008 [Cokeromyces recurvatus]